MIKTHWYQVAAILSLSTALFAMVGALGPRAVALGQDAPESMVGLYAVEMRSETRCHWNYGLVHVGDIRQDVWRFESRRRGPRDIPGHVLLAASDSVSRGNWAGVTVRGSDFVISRLPITFGARGLRHFFLDEVVIHVTDSGYEGHAITHPPASFAGRSCAEGMRFSVRLRRM